MTILTKEIIYYGSFLVIPMFFLGIFLRFYKKNTLSIIIIILSLGFTWIRFIEPQLILVKHTTIELGFTSKIAVISDLHLGLFKQDSFLNRVVKKINNQNPDYVFIAGDLTYRPNNLKKYLAPLKNIEAPVYAVYGNHDVGKPGPDIREELANILKNNNVTLLNNDIVKLKNFTLVGLGSNRNNEDNIKLLNNFTEQDNIIVLAHNPDTTLKYTNKIPDLTIAGHTHGGQVRIPFLYKTWLPIRGPFDIGISNIDYSKLFITAGVGEVGLPIRFLNPPRVDILEIN